MLQSRRLVTSPLAWRVAAPFLVSMVAVTVAAALGAPAWGWLALFLILAVTQAGHVVEHIVQLVHLRVLALPGDYARGILCSTGRLTCPLSAEFRNAQQETHETEETGPIRAPIRAPPTPVPAGCRRASYDCLGVISHPAGSDTRVRSSGIEQIGCPDPSIH